MKITPLSLFNLSAFFKSHLFLLPVLYLFYLSNGLTLADYFLFQGLIVFINVALQLPCGYIADRVERKYLLVFSYAIFLVRLFLWFFFEGWWIVLFGEICYAVSKSVFDTIESPYIYDILAKNHKEDKMVKSYSKLNFSLSLGTAIAALTGAWLYQYFGVHVLLLIEFGFICSAIILAVKLPKVVQARKGFKSIPFAKRIRQLRHIVAVIFSSPKYGAFILYSGILVAMSHFFFWSFQPFMKLALVPVVLFGVVIFVNNAMRSVCSLFTAKLMKHISLRTFGKLVFILDVLAFVFALLLNCTGVFNSVVCLVYIFYLCVCIVFQLMFTIVHISRLQQIAPVGLRAQVASANMMIARLFVAVSLILPKLLLDSCPLLAIFVIYGCCFFIVAQFLLRKVLKELPK